MKMKVKSFGHNQTEVILNPSTEKELTLFFSFEQPVACVWHNVVYRTEKFWSNTTSRHINNWLGGEDDAIRVPQGFFAELLDKYDEKGE